ncbi:MAG TPA: DUF4007 family protein [Chthoniobacterales bacterium]|nr:DUF4007 family protein [Chthoniobacterales bacterium]
MPYRISGHESFACRYAWLPKAVKWVDEKPHLFANEQEAMVDLGVGKNMVRAIRFWAHAAGMIESRTKGAGHSVTELGRAILGIDGADPFLEDIRTLWLVHWKLSTNRTSPLLAWDFLLNRWQDPKLAPSAAAEALKKEAAREDQHLSSVTLQQHFDTFLHTYIPTRGRKGEVQEDNLDSPLVELELLVKAGEREVDTGGRREAVYAFRREEKPDITPELFVYCVVDFWFQRHPREETLPFQAIATSHGSPGQIFKIPEEDIRTRLMTLDQDSKGALKFSDASNLQQLRRTRELDPAEFLDAIYVLEGANV